MSSTITPSKDVPATPIQRIDLVAEVTESLRHGIFTGDYPAQSSLPSEGDLAKKFGVSRNVVREAMRNLRTLGLVEISQGRRPHVKQPAPEAAMMSLEYLLHSSENSLAHLLEVRIPMETEIAVLAAQRAEAEDIAALEERVKALESSKNQKERIAADIEFHSILSKSTRNPMFPLILDTVTGLLHGFHELKVFPPSRVAVTVAEHSEILVAIKKGDPKKAGQAMAKHLEGVRASL